MLIDDYKNLPKPCSDYESKVIEFCKSWLGGQEKFVLKTSGSTGEPKDISLTRNQMKASALLTGETFGLKAEDTALVCLNIEYIAGVMMLVRGMVLNLKLYIKPPSGNPLVDTGSQHLDFAAFVPLQLQNILESNNEFFLTTLNKMKAIIVGGAAVGKQLHEQIQQLSVPVYSTYGMTETVSHIAVRRLNGAQASQNFKVLSGVKIGIDERKCLNILAAASNFELIQTNDLVEIITEKEFKLLGRFDNIINSGGIKIQLEKVESTIEQMIKSYQISRFFTFGIPDERLGQKLILVLESVSMDDDRKLNLIKELKKVLDTYQIPKHIFTISTFSETPTGKIDKKATIKRLNL